MHGNGQQSEAHLLPDHLSQTQDSTRDLISNLMDTRNYLALCTFIPDLSLWMHSHRGAVLPPSALHVAQRLPVFQRAFSWQHAFSPIMGLSLELGTPTPISLLTYFPLLMGRQEEFLSFCFSLTQSYVLRQPQAICLSFRDIFALLFNSGDFQTAITLFLFLPCWAENRSCHEHKTWNK